MNLKLQRRRVGPVTNLNEAINAIRDLEGLVENIINLLSTSEDNPSIGVAFLCRETDGSYGLYAVQAGAGVTFAVDTDAKTCTISSP